jgi:hypothetical protein
MLDAALRRAKTCSHCRMRLYNGFTDGVPVNNLHSLAIQEIVLLLQICSAGLRKSIIALPTTHINIEPDLFHLHLSTAHDLPKIISQHGGRKEG